MDNEVKQANRKAMPKFLLILIVSVIIGALVGYFSAIYGLNRMTQGLKYAGKFFGSHIAPWLMAVLAVLLPAVCTPVYCSAKKLLAAWNGEDEGISEAAEQKLSTVLWISSMVLIVSFFLMAASYSVGFDAVDNGDGLDSISFSIAAFVVIMI